MVPTSQEYNPCHPMVGTLPPAVGPLTVFKASATAHSAGPEIASSGTSDSCWWHPPFEGRRVWDAAGPHWHRSDRIQGFSIVANGPTFIGRRCRKQAGPDVIFVRRSIVAVRFHQHSL